MSQGDSLWLFAKTAAELDAMSFESRRGYTQAISFFRRLHCDENSATYQATACTIRPMTGDMPGSQVVK
jgi:hypothetical protein